jgi:signal transduction histidine kinase
MRIATDLHDGPIQKLTVVAFNLDRLGMRIARGEPGADELMQKIRSDIQTQMFALRRVMSDLRPPILDERNLAAALNDCADQVFADASIMHETTCELGSEWPAPEIETAVYRVVREALINVRRHAEATRVNVAIERDGESLRLLVADDGAGFERADADLEQFGLLGMQERIGSLGGRLEVASAIGDGTRVEATLPWKPRLAPAAA